MDAFNLVAKLTLDSSEYDKSLDSSQGKAEGFGSKLKSSLGTLAKAGTAAVGAASGALVAFGTSAVKTGSEFDSAMSQVAATLGLTMADIENNVGGAGDTFDLLRGKAQEMGAATNFSASEAAEGLNILAMSGFDAEQSMSMVEDVLHLAAAGSMDMASAASYVSGAMKGFNDATKDSGYYADLMAKGATLANTSVQELGDAMSSGAAGAAAYGQSADSMTVALLRLAEQGEAGAAAGTSLSAAMKNIYSPTDQAKEVLKKLGVAAYDSAGKSRDFNTVVNELDEALSGYTEEQQAAYKQTIFGIQGLNAYNKMTVTGVEKQKQWADALASASDGAGEAAKQYDTMTDNLQGDIDIWNSAVDGFKIAVSDRLMPTVRDFVKFGSDSMGTLTTAFQEGGFSGLMDSLGMVLSDGLAMITEQLPAFVEAGMSLLSSLGQGILSNLPAIGDAAIEIVMMLSTGLSENLPQIIETGLEVISQLALGIAQALPELIPTIVDVVLEIVTVMIDNVDMLVDAAIAIIVALAEGLIDALPKLLEKAPVIIQKLVEAIVRNVPKLLKAAVEIIKKLATGLIENLPKIGEAAGQIVGTVVNGIIGLWSNLLSVGGDIVRGIWEGISGMFDWLWGNVTGFFGGLVDGIKGFLGIHSPSKVFAEIGGYMAEGLGAGFEDEMADVAKQVQDATDMVIPDASVAVNSSGGYANGDGTVYTFAPGSIVFNLDGSKSAMELYQEFKRLLTRDINAQALARG